MRPKNGVIFKASPLKIARWLDYPAGTLVMAVMTAPFMEAPLEAADSCRDTLQFIPEQTDIKKLDSMRPWAIPRIRELDAELATATGSPQCEAVIGAQACFLRSLTAWLYNGKLEPLKDAVFAFMEELAYQNAIAGQDALFPTRLNGEPTGFNEV